MMLLIKLWCIRNTVNRFHFTSLSIPVSQNVQQWLIRDEIPVGSPLALLLLGRGTGSGRGCLPGRETWEGFGVCFFPVPCWVIWHLFASRGGSRCIKKGSKHLVGLLSCSLPYLALLLRVLSLVSLSTHMDRAASWCSLCAHTNTCYYDYKYLGLNFRTSVLVDVKNMNCFLFCFVWRGSSRKDCVCASFLLDAFTLSYNTEEMQLRTGIYLITKT